MAMAFTEAVKSAEPTHKLVARALPSVRDYDENGSVTVENRIVDALMKYGTAVHLQLDAKHDQFELVQHELTLVADSERIFLGSDPEYRASLPADRAIVESVLALEPDDTDEWTDRVFYLAAFAVLTERSWLYRSTPYEAHIREINATGHEELLDELQDVLDHVEGSAIVPFESLASWTADGVTYRLEWNALCRPTGEDTQVAYELERLRYVTVRRPEMILRLEWTSSSDDSLFRRITRRILTPEAATPPTHVGLPDEEAASAIIGALRQLQSSLGYSYEIDDTLSNGE